MNAVAPPGSATTLERLLRRDRRIVVAGLATVIVLAWVYVLAGAGMNMTAWQMTRMPSALDTIVTPRPWTPAYAALMFGMWWIMMIAMMLPSAAPMLLLFATVNRRYRSRGQPWASTGVFAAGYLAIWGGFSVTAVAVQFALERSGWLTSMLSPTRTWLAALILIAAGLWQLTPLKHACLKHCRSPLHYLSHRWRPGRGGAFRMGLEHGAYCLGCCWVLMALLFAGGVMNLIWIIGLATYVLLEKTVPAGHWLSHVTGVGLVGWGAWLLVGLGG